MRGSAPASGEGPRVTTHVLGAGCCGPVSVIFPKIGCAWGLHVYPLANVKLDHLSSRGPQVWDRVSGR